MTLKQHNKKVLDSYQVTPNTVWAAMFCPMTEESSFGMLSLHRSRKEAEKAIAKHRRKEKREHRDLYKKIKNPPAFDQWKAWIVTPIEILP